MLFRCLRSGNTVNIEQQDDIDRMKDHEGYAPVVDYVVEKKNETNATNEEAVQVPQEEEVLKKKPGRPKKK